MTKEEKILRKINGESCLNISLIKKIALFLFLFATAIFSIKVLDGNATAAIFLIPISFFTLFTRDRR